VYARGDDANVTVAWQTRDDAANRTTVLSADTPEMTGLSTVGTVDADLSATLRDGSVSNGNVSYYTVTTTDDDGQTSDRAVYASALPSGAARPLGNALAYDDNSSSGVVSPREATKLDGTAGTVEVWVNFEADSQQDALILGRGTGSTWELYLQGSGAERRPSFYGGFVAGTVTAPESAAISAGEWHHVAVTRTAGGEYAMYIDGEQVATSSDATVFSNGGDAPLGVGSNPAGNARLINGKIDEIRLWNTHRTDEQIADAYDRELLGFEPGLVGYWRGCTDPSDSKSTRGAARKPMTISLTNVECVDSTTKGESGGGVRTNATVRLDGAPDGLRGYRVRLNDTNGAVVESVEPRFITGRSFVVQDGGPGQSALTAAGVDVTGATTNNFTGNRTLFSVEFAGNVTRQDLQFRVLDLLDGTGADMDTDRVSVTLSPVGSEGTPFTEPLPGSGSQKPPQDLNGDGTTEDIDGNGEFNFVDVISLVFGLSSLTDLTPAQTDALDFNGDDAVNFVDVISLVFSL
jgi:hypothetical protein